MSCHHSGARLHTHEALMARKLFAKKKPSWFEDEGHHVAQWGEYTAVQVLSHERRK